MQMYKKRLCYCRQSAMHSGRSLYLRPGSSMHLHPTQSQIQTQIPSTCISSHFCGISAYAHVDHCRQCLHFVILFTVILLDTLQLNLTHTHAHTHTHTHTHTRLTALCLGLPGSASTRKVKTNLNFTEARDSEWQWHHMQVCTLLQADNHASTPLLSFYRPDALPATRSTVSKH